MTAVATPPRMSARDIERMIVNRFLPPEYAVEPEVDLGGRRIDVVVFGLWPSTGQRLVAYEIKCSRTDWLRELTMYDKAAPAMDACDAFLIVAPPGVVDVGEVPEAWGYLEAKGLKLFTRKHAPTRKGDRTMSRTIAARLVARAVQRLAERDRRDRADIERQIRADLKADADRRVEERVATEIGHLKDIERKYAEILGVLGETSVPYGHYEAMRAAAAFAKFDRDANTIRRNLESITLNLETHAKRAREALDAMGGA